LRCVIKVTKRIAGERHLTQSRRLKGAKEEMGLNFIFFFASRRGVFALNSGLRGFALCGKIIAAIFVGGQSGRAGRKTKCRRRAGCARKRP
jgi:hypothetical protein